MSKPYTPREGSYRELAQAALADHPDTGLSAAELRDQIGIKASNLASALKPLIESGLVRREGGGANVRYILAEAPPPAAPSDGPLTIAAYSDGDTHVTGGAPTDEGVLYTQAQLTQLLAFVTRPHLQPAGAERAA